MGNQYLVVEKPIDHNGIARNGKREKISAPKVIPNGKNRRLWYELGNKKEQNTPWGYMQKHAMYPRGDVQRHAMCAKRVYAKAYHVSPGGI